MFRFLSVISSFFIMLCLGGVYAWSIFVPMLKKQLDFTTTQTQIIIALTLAIFALFMVVAGKLERKYGPRKVSTLGLIFLFLGYMLASFSGGNFVVLCLGIGLLCGIGTGCCYVCGVVVAAKNFPNNKGLATGISVAGFGAGAILLSFVVKYLLGVYPDLSVLDLFKYIGVIYAIIITFFVIFQNYEGAGDPSAKVSIGDRAVSFTDKKFLVLFFTMCAGSFAGLLVLTNVKPIALSYGFAEEIATLSITVLSLGNMSGRVIWGFVQDKIGTDRSVMFAYVILIAAAIIFNFIGVSAFMLFTTIILVGLGYSCIFVLFVTKTAQIYGVDKLGLVYPYVFLSYGVAAITGPMLGGVIYDISHSYNVALVISGVISLSGLVYYQMNVKKLNA
jgi:OFA family oxalate/formate antiporter-like MFS transporter